MSKSRYAFNIRRRFNSEINHQLLYRSVLEHLSCIDPPWGFKGITFKDLQPPNKKVSSVGVSYTRELGSPIRNFSLGFLHSDFHMRLEDKPSCDDLLVCEFSLDQKNHPASYSFLMREIFPAYVEAMDAYYACLEEDKHLTALITAGKENPNINRTWKDYRHGVQNIWPANYWDRELCRRAFNLTPEQVVERVGPSVAEARVLKDGAMVIYSYERMSNDDVHEIEGKLRPLLDRR